jgi:hypothetical protein
MAAQRGSYEQQWNACFSSYNIDACLERIASRSHVESRILPSFFDSLNEACLVLVLQTFCVRHYLEKYLHIVSARTYLQK